MVTPGGSPASADSGVGAGTTSTAPHLEHLPRLPADSSATCRCVSHREQMIRMGLTPRSPGARGRGRAEVPQDVPVVVRLPAGMRVIQSIL